MPYRDPRKHKYSCQKNRAKDRGIAFELSFEEWWSIWLSSGHFEDRGRTKNQYVMARFGDTGPYAIGNVRIVTGAQNKVEQAPVDFTPELRAKLSNASKGKSKSPSHAMAIGRSKIGFKHSAASIEKMRISHRKNHDAT